MGTLFLTSVWKSHLAFAPSGPKDYQLRLEIDKVSCGVLRPKSS